jgi:hypothetical protein
MPRSFIPAAPSGATPAATKMGIKAKYNKLSFNQKLTAWITVGGLLIIPVLVWTWNAFGPHGDLANLNTAVGKSIGDGPQFNAGQISNSHVNVYQTQSSSRTNTATHKSEPLSFKEIEIDEKLCQWTEIQRPYKRAARDTKMDGSPRLAGAAAFGQRLPVWPIGSHQLSKFGDCPNCEAEVFQMMLGMNAGIKPDAHRPEKPIDTSRSIDPIFSIVMANTSDEPMVLSAIGIVPVAAWTAIKAQPGIRPLVEFDGVVIGMNGFEEGKSQMHRFDAPIQIDQNATYRVKLQLNHYNRAVTNNYDNSRNESVIRIRAVADQQTIESENLYLGLCRVRDDG